MDSILEVPIIRSIVFWGPFWGPLFWEATTWPFVNTFWIPIVHLKGGFRVECPCLLTQNP